MSDHTPQTVARVITEYHGDTLCHLRFHGHIDQLAPTYGPTEREQVYDALPEVLQQRIYRSVQAHTEGMTPWPGAA